MKHDPWNETQAPQKFERTDKTGRWSPIMEDAPDPEWLQWVGGVAAGITLALALYAWAVI